MHHVREGRIGRQAKPAGHGFAGIPRITRSYREILRFLLVGGGAALLDGCIYVFLVAVGVEIAPAKALSFALVAIVAYLLNKHFTFRRGTQSWAFVLLYCLVYTLTLGVNVLVNSIVLQVLGDDHGVKFIVAWAVATFVSASINFVALKYLVFRGARLA